MPAADSGSPSRAPRSLSAGQTVTLHLGVVDQAYRAWSMGVSGKRRRPAKVMATTTGDVASILEAKYGLFSAFARWQRPFIANAAAESVKGAIEALFMGHAIDPWGDATQKIDQRFRDFISSGMSERVGIPGSPTQAALHGVNHRLKHPYRRSNPRRPSFRDTGLLMASFRSWID